MSKIIMPALALLVLWPAGATADEKDHKQTEAEKKAVEATQIWLAVVDQEKYSEGWETAAAYLKNAVSKDAFVKALTGARKSLGHLKSRQLKSTDYRTSLPGAPDGQYVVIQFETSFENKKSAIETITPMLENDGAWKISGYFIK